MSYWKGENQPGIDLNDLIDRIVELETLWDDTVVCESCGSVIVRREALDMDHGIWYCKQCIWRRREKGQSL